MRTTALALAVLLSATVTLSAQENEKIKYSNITEFGLFTVSPRGISLEATTIHGFTMDKKHHFGLGSGVGLNFYTIRENYGYGYAISSTSEAYMPVFVNYRFYIKQNKSLSPHVNVSLGGVMTEYSGYGIYSALAMGFKVGFFSFSSGFSFMPVFQERGYYRYGYDIYGNYFDYFEYKKEWRYPFGIVVKCGFAF